MTTQIVEYSETERGLAELAHRFGNAVFDVTTKDGMKEAKTARKEIRDVRTALEAKRVEIKAPALERCRLIDAEAASIKEKLTALEKPIDDQIKAEEQRAAAAEQKRVEGLQRQLDDIKAMPQRMVGKTTGEIDEAIYALTGIVADATWAEFQDAALLAKQTALAQLHDMHRVVAAQEAEARSNAAQRAELERLRAEAAERERKEREYREAENARIAEENRKAAAEIAARRAEIERQEREARERIEAQDRQAREQREAQERKAREEQSARDAEAKRLRDEQEAAERKAREDQEAKEREIQRRINEVAGARDLLNTFVQRFGHLDEFAPVVAAIRALPKARPALRKVAG